MMKQIFALLLFLTMTASAQQSALPEPPEGYAWQWCEEIKGGFLKPDGWFFKKAGKGDTLGFFITKEDIDKEGKFLTGLTVNVLMDIPEKKNIKASDYAKLFREEARKTGDFVREWNNVVGPFQAAGFLHEKEDKAGAFKVHNLLIANDKTGTVYLVMFEAPSAEWDATWKIAEPILKQLYVDDEI